jgi:hypothetical protein
MFQAGDRAAAFERHAGRIVASAGAAARFVRRSNEQPATGAPICHAPAAGNRYADLPRPSRRQPARRSARHVGVLDAWSIVGGRAEVLPRAVVESSAWQVFGEYAGKSATGVRRSRA